jgi:hypothetical protein
MKKKTKKGGVRWVGREEGAGGATTLTVAVIT